MRNITMTIHTKSLVYKSQSNSIGLSGMAAVTSRPDSKVGKIFLLLLIKIKCILKLGSSKTFNKALIEFVFKNSILSINTNLGLLLKEDLFRLSINSLICLISIIFFS